MVNIKSGKILTYDVVFEEAEEGGYCAYVPLLPGCVSEGDTFEETKVNISEAISAYLESMSKDDVLKETEKKNFFIGKVEIPITSLSFS